MRSGRLLICLHSGVFLRRQYLAFMGQTNRALVNRFVQRCGSAAVEQPWNGSRLWLCRIDAGAILEGRVAAGTYGQILRDRGFQAFLSTQFLGAFNDNVFKIAVSYLAMSAAAGSGGSGYLTAVGAVFILPFLLFSGYAGQLADRFSKRNVLVVTKSLEIVSMGLAVVAFGHGGIAGLLAVLFLMALQSTFFSPAKYGIVPELISDRGLSRANGLLEMTTFVAIILGTSVGAFLFDVWEDRLTLMGATLVGIAVVGTLVSFRIPRVAPAGAAGAFRLNPWGEIAAGIKRLRGDRTLWLTVIGISYFFFLGTLLQMVIILFGMEVLQLDERWIGILQAFLAVGIAIGSIAAGRLSGDKVELGLVPIGSVGMGVCSMWLAGTDTFAGASALLVALGLSGGLFIVPLNALLQQRAGATEKGQLIATNNFLNTGGILLASATLWLLRDWLRIPAHQVILIFGLFTLAANVYVLSILPDFLIRFVLWLLTHSVYRIRISGQEHVPFRGPALLVCNHLSLVDGFLVGACVQRFIRFMVYKPYYEHRAVHWLFRLMKAIPVASGRRDVITSLARARAELQEGHVVCVFAEGAVSRTGNLLPFKRGFERIVKGLDVPVIPVHLDQIWGSIFSFKDGRAIWKRPRQFFRRVTVTFGAPLLSSVSPTRVRQAIQEIGAEAVGYRIAGGNMLHRRFLKTARRCWFSFAMADSTGMELTFGKALARSLALSRWIRRCCRDERMVGIMMPSSVGGALANIATLLAGKVPINLNFTVGRDVMDSAIAQCEIRTVLTSRDFLSKAKLEAPDGACFLEDAMKDISALRRLGLLLAGPATSSPRPGMALRGQVPRSRQSRHGHFLERQHENPEGCDALASKYPSQRRRRDTGVLSDLSRSDDGNAALLPLIRVHWMPLAADGDGLRRRVPLQPAGRGRHRRARQEVPDDAHHEHPYILQRVYPQVRHSGFRGDPLRHRRGREAARAGGQGVQGEVRHRHARGLRLYRDVARGRGQRARQRR